jgi:hypothetical protein
MNAQGKKLILAMLHALEELHLRNLALETILRSYGVSGWELFANGLATDKRIHPEIREIFREVYAKLECEPSREDDEQTVEQFLKAAKITGKPN